jgi:hypothetical protein
MVVTLSQQEEKKDLERGAGGSHSFIVVPCYDYSMMVM